MSLVIQITTLAKAYGARQVLRDVGFEVRAGERIALIGPSGAGKSTLMRSMAGLIAGDRHSKSEISVGGLMIQRDGHLLARSRRERCRTAYIFQQFNLAGRLSVLTNVLIGNLGRMPRWRALLGLFSANERVEAMEALRRVGLAEFAGQRANTLSGGQQQRVAIARALVQRADVILADEPIASLDPRSAREVMEILSRISEEDGKTLVVSLHQVDYARNYCQRAIALRNGELHFDGPVAQLDERRLHALYESPASVATEPPRQPVHAVLLTG